MLRSLLLASLLASPLAPAAHAQQRPGQLLVYAEAGGASINLFSVNAEYAPASRLGARVGYGTSFGLFSGVYGTVHLYSASGRWELAAGANRVADEVSDTSDGGFWPVGYAGYRRVPARGVLFRAGVSLFYGDGTPFGLPGLSVGYAF